MTTSGGDEDFGDYAHDIELFFEFDTERRASVVGDAVGVEVGQIDDERSTARVSRTEKTLRVHVAAHDLTALRAGVNTWIRLVRTAEDVCDAVA